MNDRPYTQRDMLVFFFFFGIAGVVVACFVALALVITTTCEGPKSARGAPIAAPEDNHAAR